MMSDICERASDNKLYDLHASCPQNDCECGCDICIMNSNCNCGCHDELYAHCYIHKECKNYSVNGAIVN